MDTIKESIDYPIENKRLRAEIASLKAKIIQLEASIQWYLELLRIAKRKQYCPSSEMSDGTEQLTLGYFNEVESISNEKPPAPEETIRYTRKKRVGKRAELYANLPTEQIVHELPEEERVCPGCGGPLHACGHEVLRREVKVIPIQFYSVEHVQTVYSCRSCEQSSESEAVPMVKTPVPSPVIPKSGVAGASLLSFIICNKYVLAQPLYRQERELARNGLNISRQTMANWLIHVALISLKPLYDLLRQTYLGCSIGHADETTVQVIREDGRKSSQKSYMWVYATGQYADTPIILFNYQQTRKSEHPLTFLSGFTGYLHTDAYAGYRKLEEQGVTLVECFAHLRRKFDEALKVLRGEERSDSPAAIGLAYCNKLFALERKYDEEALTPDRRLEQRNLRSKPIAEAFFDWVQTVPYVAKSKLGIAVVYAINQKERLMNVFLDGRLELSNNRAERAIRPFAVGRKNWLFSYCPKGAQASAILYSIIETAHANGLMPFSYLNFLFDTLPNISEGQIYDCLPWNPQVKALCCLPKPPT